MGYFSSNDHLAHHGIKGQRWGVRRFQNRDGTRTDAGKKRQQENSDRVHKGLSDKQKKILVGAGVTAGVLLAAYGGYKVSQIYKGKTGERGIEGINEILYNDRIDAISKQRVVTTLSKPYLQMSDSEKRETIGLLNSESGKHNCQFCTAAFDVAMKTGKAFSIRGDADSASFEGDSFPKRLYKNFPGFKTLQSDSCSDFASKLIKESGEGSFGRINSSGHAMSYYIQNGKLRIMESQNKRDFSPEEIDSRFKSVFNWESANFARTDNLDFTDEGLEYLARFAQRNKS